MKRGRPSKASLEVVTVISADRPEPLAGLSEHEAALWRGIVQSLAADYFRPADLPVLAAYCQAVAQHETVTEALRREEMILTADNGRKYRNPLLAVQHTACARMASLAVKLRLCPSSRFGERKAFGAGKAAGKKPWERAES